MKKLKSFSGFSLMEMMVVLLIVAVVMAAAAPMVSRKMANSIANGGGSDSFWEQLNGVGRRSIGYNAQQVNNRDTVVIGERNPGFPANTDIPRFVVSSNSAGVPQIRLRENLLVNPRNLDINFSNESVLVTDNNTQQSRQAVVVGFGAQGGPDTDSTAVGYQADSTGNMSTAVGYRAQATVGNSTALGHASRATADSATAVGRDARAEGELSTVIGFNSSTDRRGSIVLGTNNRQNSGDNVIAIGNDINGASSDRIQIDNGATHLNADAVSVAIGAGTNLGSTTVAIGRDATALSTRGISLGWRSEAGQGGSHDAIAIGSPFNDSNPADSNCRAASNDIAIGKGAFAAVNGSHVATNSIAIGVNAYTHSANAIAIGSRGANGKNTTAATDAIAIGTAAQSLNDNSVAIGANAQAIQKKSVAIGPDAVADKENQIVLGGSGSTVYIPGNLVVGKYTLLGAQHGYRTYVRHSDWKNKFPFSDGTQRIRELARNGDDGTWHLYNDEVPSQIRDYVPSDRQLKNVGEAFKGGLAELKKLEFFHYTFKEDESKTPRVGVMAQDLQKVFPDAAIKGEDGFLRIRLEDMFYAVINAVKELDTRLTALTEQVKSNIDLTAKLQKQVNEQSEQIAELKKQNAEFEKRLAKLERKARKGNVEE